MPDLFPSGPVAVEGPSVPDVRPLFGRSWRFDFEAGEFVVTPTGKIAEARDTDAWVQWCEKAIRTPRYYYLIYSRFYGQEFDDLIARHLPRPACELEIARITTETLMEDPRTAEVGAFAFTWGLTDCAFTCEITNVLGTTDRLQGRVVM